jgi:hypothetical protein
MCHFFFYFSNLFSQNLDIYTIFWSYSEAVERETFPEILVGVYRVVNKRPKLRALLVDLNLLQWWGGDDFITLAQLAGWPMMPLLAQANK